MAEAKKIGGFRAQHYEFPSSLLNSTVTNDLISCSHPRSWGLNSRCFNEIRDALPVAIAPLTNIKSRSLRVHYACWGSTMHSALMKGGSCVRRRRQPLFMKTSF